MEEFIVKCTKDCRIYYIGPFQSIKRAEEAIVNCCKNFTECILIKKRTKTMEIISLKDKFFGSDEGSYELVDYEEDEPCSSCTDFSHSKCEECALV